MFTKRMERRTLRWRGAEMSFATKDTLGIEASQVS